MGRVRSLPSGVFGTELRKVTVEMGHGDRGTQLLLFTNEETEGQRLA